MYSASDFSDDVFNDLAERGLITQEDIDKLEEDDQSAAADLAMDAIDRLDKTCSALIEALSAAADEYEETIDAHIYAEGEEPPNSEPRRFVQYLRDVIASAMEGREIKPKEES